LPTLYVSIARPDDKLPQPCETPAESATVLKKFRSVI
jgi:hypothetical protein